tara:strand:- start:562 stop:741 length:180 start_codon:yes stop_codon:yes gene_type:complete
MYKKFKLDPNGSAVTNMINQIKDKDGNSITPKTIPFDEANIDYQAYLEWAKTNTPEEAD